MEMEQCNIQMEIDMKEYGKMGKKMDMENIFIIMELFIREISPMEKKVDLGRYFLLMEQEYKLIGNKLIFKEMEKFTIRMEIISREIIICLRNMAKDYIFGQLKIVNIKEILEKIF